MSRKTYGLSLFLLIATLLITSCQNGSASSVTPVPSNNNEVAVGDIGPANLQPGEKLKVVATTSIVADVVSNVGGDHIDLTGLMPPGSDPHSFTATPQDLRSLNDANVIFINGLNLEESLMPVLQNPDKPVPMVSVSDGIDPLMLSDEGLQDSASNATTPSADNTADDGHAHDGVDPHAWFSVANVKVWVENIQKTLSALDPANAEVYQMNAEAYLTQLDELQQELAAQVETIPEENRKIVTDHIELGYLARDFGFSTVGSILPSISTLAASSAQELASLQKAMSDQSVKALFVSTSVNVQTATQLANDLGIPVVKVYTGSLSDADGPASTYIDLMRYDMTQIVDALK